jgi:ADP-ribose pyrophosphatase
MQFDFEIIERQVCFDGFFRLDRFDVRYRTFAGGLSSTLRREVFLRGHAVAILPYDPKRDRVVLIEQFRIGAAAAERPAWLMEIPAGIVENDETVEDVAHREVKEEAGLDLLHLQPIVEFMPSPGGSSEVVHVLGGRIDRETVTGVFGLDEEGEDIRTHYLTREEAFALIDQGRIDNSFTIIALQWLMLNGA